MNVLDTLNCQSRIFTIGYSFTINSINEKYFSDMLQLAEDSFADEIEMSEILNVNQNLNISSLMLSEKQSKNFRINTLKGFSISKAFRKGMGLYRYKKGTEYICSAGTKNIFIDINGDVYPCNLFANHNEYFAGNVFSEDLLEIWRKSKVFIELRNLKKEDIEECANCPASENCKGGKIVEIGTAEEVYYDPRHPYTWGLMRSLPAFANGKESLYTIPGMPPTLIDPPKGDAFACRNEYALNIDYEEMPPMFKITDTHYAATWLLDPRAPQIKSPVGGIVHE